MKKNRSIAIVIGVVILVAIVIGLSIWLTRDAELPSQSVPSIRREAMGMTFLLPEDWKIEAAPVDFDTAESLVWVIPPGAGMDWVEMQISLHNATYYNQRGVSFQNYYTDGMTLEQWVDTRLDILGTNQPGSEYLKNKVTDSLFYISVKAPDDPQSGRIYFTISDGQAVQLVYMNAAGLSDSQMKVLEDLMISVEAIA